MSNVAREAELLGRLKDTDLWVRNNADVAVGIFGVLMAPDTVPMLNQAVAGIDQYKEDE